MMWLYAVATLTLTQAPPLQLWHAYRGAEETALTQIVSAYEKQSGQHVELLAVPYDAFSSKIANAIGHNSGPDVFIFAHERLLQFVDTKIIAKVTSQFHANDYLASAASAIQYENDYYAFPLSVKCLALYYNKRFVIQPPDTTDDLLKIARAFVAKKTDRFGLAYEAGDFYYHAAFVTGFGASLFDSEGRASFNTPQHARAFQFVKKLQDEKVLPEEVSSTLVVSLFNNEKTPFAISGPWLAGDISKNVSFGVVPLPVVSETQKRMSPLLGVEAAFVSSASKQTENATRLARHLASFESAVTRAQVAQQVPAAKAALASEAVKENEIISQFIKAAEYATPVPSTLEMSKLWEPMKLALRAVTQGTIAPENGGALADRRYRALFREVPEEASKRPYVALIVLGAVAALFFGIHSLRKKRQQQWHAYAYVTPALAGLLVLVFVPLSYGALLAFFHHDGGGHYHFVGLANIRDVVASRAFKPTEPLSFYFTLAVTVLWTVVNVTLHVSLGVALALALKKPLGRLRPIYRIIFILPWSVPNYITALIWKGLFHRQFGAINAILSSLGFEPVSWFAKFSTSFAANVVTNTWLGFPFMMVVALGALQTIPPELYEAAQVDGASSWQKFRHVTLPHLRPAMAPAVALGIVWTFNMFNIIYLVSGGEPGGGTDILVSEAFRWAFQRNEQYGFAASYALVIFLLLVGWNFASKRIFGALPEKANA